jgi:hypothetical protein
MDTPDVFTYLAAVTIPSTGGPEILGIPIEFGLFAVALLGIAVFHRHTLIISLAGLVAIAVWKLRFGSFAEGGGWQGLVGHIAAE